MTTAQTNLVCATLITSDDMEQETLFTASKWEILKLLERGALSPIELANLSRTSVANVSQQLRLLEMAGIVKSERVSNRDKGQPRVLYSIAGNSCYVISTANSFVDKKHHQMSFYNKIILRVWFHPELQEHYFIEKAFWQIDHLLHKLDSLSVSSSKDELTFHLLTSQKLPELSPVTFTDVEGRSRKIVFTTKQGDEFAYSLYDSEALS